MKDDNEKYVTFRQNPNIDFLFGHFGDMPVPTKQDGYKPIEVVQIDEDGVETILKDFYQRKPDTVSVQKFKKYRKLIKNGSVYKKRHNWHIAWRVLQKRVYQWSKKEPNKNAKSCKNVDTEGRTRIEKLAFRMESIAKTKAPSRKKHCSCKKYRILKKAIVDSKNHYQNNRDDADPAPPFSIAPFFKFLARN